LNSRLGERGVEQARLGRAEAQAPNGRQRLDGLVVGLVLGPVVSQPLEGAA